MTTHHVHFSHPKYRPDIDGLRAIAVLAVVAYHAFPNWLRGGFIGVDIFFVISGYLISTIIFENLDKGTFSFAEFYARRVKRIFPALFLVLISCFAFGWFALLADEFKQLGKHIIGGTAFVSNLVLWSESGYFDNAADTKPLLHLWSLGIEEQFYIAWPLISWFAHKKRFNLLSLGIFVAIASFYLNIHQAKTDVVADFYSPQTRFWELMLGSILAWITHYKPNLRATKAGKTSRFFAKIIFMDQSEDDGKTLASVISVFALLLISYGYWQINKAFNFPGHWALIPVLGAVLLIYAGPNAWVNRTILSNKIAVWFGLISFPLYLWHWPLLSFARIVEGELPSRNVRIAAVIIAVMLAWLTFKFVEKPIRFGKHNKITVFLLIVLMSITGYVGYGVYERNGLPFRLKDRESFNEYFENSIPNWKFYTEHKIFTAFRSDCDFYDLEKYRNGKATLFPVSKINQSCYTADISKSHRVMLWGDSHAQQLYYGLKQNLPNDWQILLGVSSGCIPALVDGDSNDNYCIKSNFNALSTIKLAKPDVVIVAQNSGHNISNSLRVYKALKELGIQKVIFTGPVPHWKSDLPKIITRKLWIHTPQRTFLGIDKNLISINKNLKDQYIANDLQFVDIISLFCNDNGCLTRIGDDKLTGITTHDYGHLLPIASDYLAKNLLVQKIASD